MQPTEPSFPSDKPNCIEMLQSILDGDATHEQHQQFKQHMECCMPCYKKYNLEMTIKELLKTKCSGNGAPPELIDKIKNHINQNIPH
jgi:anti-sigma factor (TIGR02949 family)